MLLHDKFIWSHLPKTGGHFMNEWYKLIPNCKRTNRTIQPLSHYADDRIKWSIIRNPYDFYVSWWGCNKDQPNNQIGELVKGKENFGQFLEYTMNKEGGILHRWIDFNKMNEMDIGLMTFCYIWSNCDYEQVFKRGKLLKKDVLLDHELRFENFREAIEGLFDNHIFKLNDEQRDFLRNHSKECASDHEHYTKYYNKELIDLVNHKDRFIFNLFPDYLWKPS